MKKIIFGLVILLVGCKNINNDDSIFNSEEVIIDDNISWFERILNTLTQIIK